MTAIGLDQPEKKSKDSQLARDNHMGGEIKLVPQRWLVLAVFTLITGLNAFEWIDYIIIQDVTMSFYSESLPVREAEKIDAVNWFSINYMLIYIILVFPAMFLLERKGLRLACTLGALLTFLGVSLKCATLRPHLFDLAMAGQIISAIGQTFILGVPARLSALWFGTHEIGLATSVSTLVLWLIGSSVLNLFFLKIGVFGNQLGTALGFLIPPIVVVKSDSAEFMRERFIYLMVPLAVLCGLATILAILSNLYLTK
jgi:FLVCR family feline leukemia virus subgroup C receptor-related protein